MAKKPSSKREKAEKAERAEKAQKSQKEESGDYEFPMPDFDEKAFMRREVESARITFWAAGVAVAVGALSFVFHQLGGNWLLGWLPIIGGLLLLGPMLRKLGFSEENTSPKAMFGNWFLLFFTALVVWVLAVNVF